MPHQRIMPILNVEGRRTPIQQSYSSVPNLHYVSEELRKNPTPRDYPGSPFQSLALSPEAGPCTPLYPDPMQPVQYFRVLSEISFQMIRPHLPNVEPRESIKDPRYWREEVKFFCQFVPSFEKRREQIDSVTYWKCEAKYFRELHDQKIQGSGRLEITKRSYWKRELAFLRQLPEIQSKDRKEIDDAEYWRIEKLHYDELQAENLSASTHLHFGGKRLNTREASNMTKQPAPKYSPGSSPSTTLAPMVSPPTKRSDFHAARLKRKREDQPDLKGTVPSSASSEILPKRRRMDDLPTPFLSETRSLVSLT